MKCETRNHRKGSSPSRRCGRGIACVRFIPAEFDKVFFVFGGVRVENGMAPKEYKDREEFPDSVPGVLSRQKLVERGLVGST